MSLRKLKRLTSITLIVSLVVSSSVPYIRAKASSYNDTGEEVIDEVVEELIAKNQELEDMEDALYEDLEMLDTMGLDAETIVDTTVDGKETIVYDLKMTDIITDEVTVERSDDAIVIHAVEDEKENELLVQDNGDIYLDGKKIIIDEDSVNNGEHSEEEENFNADIIQSTGGWHWYESSKAPSKLKKAKYKPYPTSPTSKCSNIPLHNAICNVAISILVSLLVTYLSGGTGAITLASAGKDSLAGIIAGFVTYDPNTKNFSAIYYIANCKDNNRYRRKKCYIYSKKNYKGKKSVATEYGLMM